MSEREPPDLDFVLTRAAQSPLLSAARLQFPRRELPSERPRVRASIACPFDFAFFHFIVFLASIVGTKITKIGLCTGVLRLSYDKT